MSLKNLSFKFLILIISVPLFISSSFANGELTNTEKENIITEINAIFEKSIKASEKLDITGITENVDDTLRTGFIDNGVYFNSFDILMEGFKEAVKGIESQRMIIVDKKTTVLSCDVVLLTTSGNYETKIEDGRILKGKFAWSFLYAKINDEWKIVHSHMSNPR